MDIPNLPLANFANKMIKILSGEDSSIAPLALKNQLQTGKLLQVEIIKLLPKGKATVSIAGQKVVADLLSLKTQNDSVSVKPEYAFKPGQKIYARVENVNPESILKLVHPPQQKVQEEGYTTNLSRKIKPEVFKFEKFSELKLPPDRIVQVSVNRVVDSNTLSVQFEDQEVFVKTENAKFYRPDTDICIQFQKTDSGFKSVFLDSQVKPDNVDLELIKPYLPSRRPLGKLVGELTRDILNSPKTDSGFKSVFLDSPVKPGNVDLELIKPYLPSRRPLGKLVGELTRDILDSPILKELKIQPQLLEKLSETLQVLTPKIGVTPDEVEIEEQVEKSGVRYEAKIKQFLKQTENHKMKLELAKDLKGQLLDLLQVTEKSIKNFSEQNQRRQISAFQQRLEVSVDSIELNQLSSRVATQENQPLVLQIPNPLSPREKTINLFIHEDSEGGQDGKKGDKEFYNMAFFLNLSALGNIKINAKVGPESLAVRMEVEQDDMADFIRNNLAEFEQRMENKDLNTTVECCAREEVTPIKDNLIELLVSQNASLLSVKT